MLTHGVIGWTDFSHQHSIHEVCRNFQHSLDLSTIYFAHITGC